MPSKLTLKRGDAISYTIVHKSSSGAAIDLTGFTIDSQLRYNYSDVAPAATATIVITDAFAGEFTLKVSAATTALLSVGAMIWDIQYTPPSGDVYSTNTVFIDMIGDATQ